LSRVSSIVFFEGVLEIWARDGVRGATEYDASGLQVNTNGLVLDPDAGLLGHVVSQTTQCPQRERQAQAAGTAAHGVK
jgi:hypothetical protein